MSRQDPVVLHLDANQEFEVLKLASTNVSLKDICEGLGCHFYVFMQYRRSHPDFEVKLRAARLDSAHIVADDIQAMARDETIHPGITRNMLEAAKWTSSKRNPAEYGEKMEMNLNQNVDISRILDAATQRIPLDVTPRDMLMPGESEETFVSNTIDLSDLL